jgi:hypothetical protein
VRYSGVVCAALWNSVRERWNSSGAKAPFSLSATGNRGHESGAKAEMRVLSGCVKDVSQ